MKWVAITLLLLNGVYLAIQLNQTQDPKPTVERFPFSGPPLMLVSEQQEYERANQAPARQTPQQVAQTPASPPASARPESAPQPTPQPEVAQAPREAPAPAAPPVPEAAPKPAPKPQPAPAPKPVTSAKPKSNAMACYSVGPFLLISDVRGVSQLFRYGDIKVSERSEALRKQVGYWAYIPPFETLRQARDAMKELKANGVGDALIISEGSKANAISVGVYKTEALGLERQRALDELGFQAKVEPLFRTQSQYWLELELMKSTQIPAKLWSEVTAGYPDIQQLRHKCE